MRFWPCTDLRQHKAVVALVARILRFIAHGVEEEHGHKLCCTAAWCWVTEDQTQRAFNAVILQLKCYLKHAAACVSFFDLHIHENIKYENKVIGFSLWKRTFKLFCKISLIFFKLYLSNRQVSQLWLFPHLNLLKKKIKAKLVKLLVATYYLKCCAHLEIPHFSTAFLSFPIKVMLQIEPSKPCWKKFPCKKHSLFSP